MTYTRFDATLELARLLADVLESTATGGTTTTVVDTANLKPAGYYSGDDGGTLWLKLSTPATKRITGHTPVGTITFTPAQSAAIAAGNRYAAAPADYPHYVLVQALEHALDDIGTIPTEKTITAVADREDYDNDDDAIFDNKIVDVFISASTTDPNLWTRHQRWDQVYISTGKLTLRFDEFTCPTAALPMRIVYLNRHAELTADSAIINPIINPELLVALARVHAVRWMYQRKGQDDPSVVALLNEAQTRANVLKVSNPITTTRKARLAKW